MDGRRWGIRDGRWFVAAFLILMALPALIQVLLPAPVNEEQRPLAGPPAWPRSGAEWRDLPVAIDHWVNDRFGLRQPLVRINNWARWHLWGEIATPRIAIGRHGRLFLDVDDAGSQSLITRLCGINVGDAAIEAAALAITQRLARIEAAGFDVTLLIVPTAPRLYPEDLPSALGQRCQGLVPPADRVAAGIEGGAMASALVYPLALMQGFKTAFEPIPRHHFHWAGEAPLRVAEAIAEGRWQLPRTLDLPLRAIGRASDLNRLNPGMGAADRIREPDVRAVGVRTCVAEACGPIEGLPAAAAFAIERYTRPAPGPALLIIADSFGDEIARDFLEQFGEVWRVVTNDLAALSPTDRRALAGFLQGRFAGQKLLLVYHDAAALDGLPVLDAVFRPDRATD